MADAVIRSRTNPLVKRLRALKERAAGTDLALLEGFTLVEEALASGLEIVEAALTTRAAETAGGHDVTARLAAAGVATI